ncbi:MAG: alpha/beta fold hydrolase [Mycobacterium sp.]|nr:MAG: alpha/beta fold hydrolase [Mycobacterium sp.]
MNAPPLRPIDRTVLARDGVRLAVRDYPAAAEDVTVVLLHGFCLNQDSWGGQVHRLRRHWGARARIITYDHRGHGRSGGASSRTYRIPTLADDLDAVLAALHVRTPLVLVGHSMGGMTALTFAARDAAEQSATPHGLVLVATAAGRLTERGLGRLLALPAVRALPALLGHVPDHLLRSLAGPVCTGLARSRGCEASARHTLAAAAASAMTTTPLSTALGFLAGLRDYNAEPVLSSVTAHTVIVSGGADVLTPPAHAEDMAARIAGATRVHLPAAGHMLTHDAPRTITNAILRVATAPVAQRHSPLPALALAGA